MRVCVCTCAINAIARAAAQSYNLMGLFIHMLCITCIGAMSDHACVCLPARDVVDVEELARAGDRSGRLLDALLKVTRRRMRAPIMY